MAIYRDFENNDIFYPKTVIKRPPKEQTTLTVREILISEGCDLSTYPDKYNFTYADLQKLGYVKDDCTTTQGYISRKEDINTQIVQVGKGSRKNQLYIEVPSFKMTLLHFRYYLKKVR